MRPSVSAPFVAPREPEHIGRSPSCEQRRSGGAILCMYTMPARLMIGVCSHAPPCSPWHLAQRGGPGLCLAHAVPARTVLQPLISLLRGLRKEIARRWGVTPGDASPGKIEPGLSRRSGLGELDRRPYPRNARYRTVVSSTPGARFLGALPNLYDLPDKGWRR